MARNGDKWSFQAPGKVLHESGFAAAGRPFQHEGNSVLIRRGGDGEFVALGKIKGLMLNDMLFDFMFFCLHHVLRVFQKVMPQAVICKQKAYSLLVELYDSIGYYPQYCFAVAGRGW